MRWRDPATSAARPGVPRPVRAAAPVAVLLVVLAEEVAFAGQPTSADTATIAAYYGGHVAGVVWGNVLWIAAALLLLVAVRRATLRAAWWGPSPWLLSLAAATAMGLTSAAAALLTAVAPVPEGASTAISPEPVRDVLDTRRP